MNQLRAWLNTPTWLEPRQFLREHPDLLADPRTADVLESISADNAVARQHLGIIELSFTLPLTDIYDAISDAETAADMAITALLADNINTVNALHAIAPRLQTVPHTGSFVLAVIAALQGEKQAVVRSRNAAE